MDYLTLNQTTPPGYSYLDTPALEVIASQSSTAQPQSSPHLHPCHYHIPAPGLQTLWFTISQPPPPKTCTSFLSDFTDFYTQLSSISPSVLFLGDFNIHVDNPHSKCTADFLDILNCLNLMQHVNSPTLSHGHILDLICSSASLSVHNIPLTGLNLSDHQAVTIDIYCIYCFILFLSPLPDS
ncbi:unnamed protein product [Knipowitschia caucasica]|uniref:Endonuclease/exonuclease/phosphatase domain-containing protein n=1 Tax=Knipowitschia caucasica TaxID=637954 RepID=A0AAV2J4C9_KNICA